MSESRKRAVLLFSLDPSREQKTAASGNGRLSPFLWSIIQDVVQSVREMEDTHLFITMEKDGVSFREKIESRFAGPLISEGRLTFLPFGGTDFDFNLKDSIDRVFRRGFGHLVVVANDSPFCGRSDFERAFSRLEQGDDAVLGPCRDGGVYCLGLNAGVRCLDSIPWKTSGVFRAIRRNLKKGGYRAVSLPVRRDIDRWGDLFSLRKFSRGLQVHFRDLLAKRLEIFSALFQSPPLPTRVLSGWTCLIYQKSPPISFVF